PPGGVARRAVRPGEPGAGKGRRGPGGELQRAAFLGGALRRQHDRFAGDRAPQARRRRCPLFPPGYADAAGARARAADQPVLAPAISSRQRQPVAARPGAGYVRRDGLTAAVAAWATSPGRLMMRVGGLWGPPR